MQSTIQNGPSTKPAVTLGPTLENFAGLGLLVVVRTILAWSLVLEAESRWPWQVRQTDTPAD